MVAAQAAHADMHERLKRADASARLVEKKRRVR